MRGLATPITPSACKPYTQIVPIGAKFYIFSENSYPYIFKFKEYVLFSVLLIIKSDCYCVLLNRKTLFYFKYCWYNFFMKNCSYNLDYVKLHQLVNLKIYWMCIEFPLCLYCLADLSSSGLTIVQVNLFPRPRKFTGERENERSPDRLLLSSGLCWRHHRNHTYITVLFMIHRSSAPWIQFPRLSSTITTFPVCVLYALLVFLTGLQFSGKDKKMRLLPDWCAWELHRMKSLSIVIW